MKNIFLIIAVISVAFTSCDGRKSKSESLKSSISEFNQKQSGIEIINYYPKEYTEVVTDTIISNKVKIHIKNYSLPNETISMSSFPTKNIQKLHRVFESEIVVSIPSKIIFNAHISAEQFKAISTDEFWNNATLQQVWVNQELSTTQNIKLNLSFINPKEDSYKLYQMSINANGQQELKLIEQS